MREITLDNDRTVFSVESRGETIYLDGFELAAQLAADGVDLEKDPNPTQMTEAVRKIAFQRDGEGKIIPAAIEDVSDGRIYSVGAKVLLEMQALGNELASQQTTSPATGSSPPSEG